MHPIVPIWSMPHEVVFVDIIYREQQYDRLMLVRGRDLNTRTKADQVTEFMKKIK